MCPLAIDCVLGDWTPWGDCDQVCGPGFKHRTRPITTPAQFGGANCSDNLAEEMPCDLMAELKAKVATLETKNKALQRMATCDVSKCTAVVYKKCDGSPLCGTGQNGVTCAYLPDGIGQTGCGEEACDAVDGTTEMPFLLVDEHFLLCYKMSTNTFHCELSADAILEFFICYKLLTNTFSF